jgi:hypothetical protein
MLKEEIMVIGSRRMENGVFCILHVNVHVIKHAGRTFTLSPKIVNCVTLSVESLLAQSDTEEEEEDPKI